MPLRNPYAYDLHQGQRIQFTPASAKATGPSGRQKHGARWVHAMASTARAATAPLSKASRLAGGRVRCIHSLQEDSDAEREAAIIALVEPLALNAWGVCAINHDSTHGAMS